jgi:MFS family permease
MAAYMENGERAAKFYWLPPGLRPPCKMSAQQERVFLLVGMAALFAGYDMNVFGYTLPQIQASLDIPEDKIGITVSIFRLAALVALPLVWTADLVGRRRLLLVTIFGQALATLATGFVQDYHQFLACQFVTRAFGYAEEMLCFVVVAEEVAARARGWASGTLATLDYAGAGIAALIFAAITYIPYGWRSLYIIGSLPIFLVGFLRRWLPETKRFETRKSDQAFSTRFGAALDMLGKLRKEHPKRLAWLLIGVGAFGFSLWPAVVLGPKYLQTALHFTPPQTTLLTVVGGVVAAVFNIMAGRISDRIGRRTVCIATAVIAVVCYGTFYSGWEWRYTALMWAPGFFGFLCADALFAGLSAELFPTAYRATVSGLRYFVGILCGAVSMALEGVFYNYFGGHGHAIIAMMALTPIALIALFMLPEPAGKSLEDVADMADGKVKTDV